MILMCCMYAEEVHQPQLLAKEVNLCQQQTTNHGPQQPQQQQQQLQLQLRHQ